MSRDEMYVKPWKEFPITSGSRESFLAVIDMNLGRAFWRGKFENSAILCSSTNSAGHSQLHPLLVILKAPFCLTLPNLALKMAFGVDLDNASGTIKIKIQDTRHVQDFNPFQVWDSCSSYVSINMYRNGGQVAAIYRNLDKKYDEVWSIKSG